jgi:squalene-associated FAD-dependent desaturase
MSAPVVVIGAGFAGLSAAVRLADAGIKVTVLEEAPRLGGRATAFADRESGERVDNGQHVLFGCYRETYAFLRRIGTAGLAPLDRRLNLRMAGPDGRHSSLRCPSLPPPWHLVAGVLGWKALGFRDRLSTLKLRTLLREVRRDGAAAVAARVPKDQTVAAWLEAAGQSPKLCEWLWHPLAIAALNQSPRIAAAAPFVRVLGELFGADPASAAIGLPAVPLDDLYATPAKAFIESRGGVVLMKAAARIDVNDAGAIRAVRVGDDAIATTRVISAVPWFAFGRVWNRAVPESLAGVAAAAAAMDSSPIVTVNLWFDGRVLPETGARFVGLVRGPVQWVFDKQALWGGAAGHVSAVASGADAIVRMTNEEIADLAVRQLGRALPGVAGRRLVRSVVVREPRATFSLALGGPPRPSARTALPGFYLAGDWTDTGLPGTIEGAVASGHRAAELVIRTP